MGAECRKDFRPENIAAVMYSYGDSPQPLAESVAAMSSMVKDYITDMIDLAVDLESKGVASRSKRGRKIDVKSIKFLVRRDKEKIKRIEEVIKARRQIEAVRSEFSIEKLAKSR